MFLVTICWIALDIVVLRVTLAVVQLLLLCRIAVHCCLNVMVVMRLVVMTCSHCDVALDGFLRCWFSLK